MGYLYGVSDSFTMGSENFDGSYSIEGNTLKMGEVTLPAAIASTVTSVSVGHDEIVTTLPDHTYQLGDLVDVYWSTSGAFRCEVTDLDGDDVTIAVTALGAGEEAFPNPPTAIIVAPTHCFGMGIEVAGTLKGLFMSSSIAHTTFLFENTTAPIHDHLPVANALNCWTTKSVVTPYFVVFMNLINDIQCVRVSHPGTTGPGTIKVGLLL